MLSLRSLSQRRFRVLGRLPSFRGDGPSSGASSGASSGPPSDASSDGCRRLAGRRFRPLSPHETATYGWVDSDNLLRTEFTPDTVWRGKHAVFALRIDRRRPDPRLLKARVEIELEARRKAAADGAGRIGLEERRRIASEIEAELLASANPSIRVCPVLVEPRAKVVHALTRSRPVLEILLALFRETFEVDLVPLTPWGRAREILAGLPAAEILDGLERTDFAALASSESASGEPRVHVEQPRMGAEQPAEGQR